MNAANYPAGFMMELTNYDVNGEKFSMTAIEVNLNAPKTVSTTGYMVYQTQEQDMRRETREILH